MSTEVELRYLPADADTELRYVPEDGKPGKIVGYAATFNSLSHELGDRLRKFREVVRPGAFAESLRNRDDILARGDHGALLGRTSAGTLRLEEDARGLRYEIDIPDTTDGHNYRELVRRGDIKGSSFAFKVQKSGGENWRSEPQGMIRELLNVSLIDVSPVARPAYPSTEIALRSLEEWRSQTETKPEEKQEEAKPDEVTAEQMQANRNKLRLAQAKGAK